MYQRPGTSQSVRPESSMSSRGHSIPPVVVKKTRAPAQPRQPRPEPVKSSRVRKKSPLNEGPSAQDGANDVPPPKSTSAIVPPVPSAPQSDIDSLTSGMQKVKISLVTKNQKEAKEQTKRAPKTTKRAPAKTTKASKPLAEAYIVQEAPAAPPASTEAVKNELPTSILPPMETEPTLPSTPKSSLPPQFAPHLQQPSEIPLPASSPFVPVSVISPTTSSSSQPSLGTSNTSEQAGDVFIPYQPEGPTPEIATQQQPIRWLPANTMNTPSPMKRGELPVFTSGSVIPFAPNPMQKPQLGGAQQAGARPNEIRDSQEGVWEIPETPQK